MNKNKIITVNKKKFKLNISYILGFFEGDGSCVIQLKPNSNHKTGKQVVLIFNIHQHQIDKDFLTAISIFLGCGKVEIGNKGITKDGLTEIIIYRLRISRQSEVLNILLPILKENLSNLILKKRFNTIKLFIQACELVKNKEHTTLEGQERIKLISDKFSFKLNLEERNNLESTIGLLNHSEKAD
jgi:hypothetical protein